MIARVKRGILLLPFLALVGAFAPSESPVFGVSELRADPVWTKVYFDMYGNAHCHDEGDECHVGDDE